jgi:hypothetical protein
MSSVAPNQAAASDLLELYPGGYPVEIDVQQAHVHGLGTAMHFLLPPGGHNFPLTHHNERKLVVALAGGLRVQRGPDTLARLRCGQGVLIERHAAHRIHQDGATPSMVGVALWPGAVEQAFRAVAALVAMRGFQRAEIIDLFARYQVQWDAAPAPGGQPGDLEAAPFCDLVAELPSELAAALSARWAPWLRQC